MYQVKYKRSVKLDLKKIKQSHLKDAFIEVLKTLQKDPFEQSQSVEKLEPKSLGLYSRRINTQYRVVYSVDNENKTVYIFSAWSHV